MFKKYFNVITTTKIEKISGKYFEKIFEKYFEKRYENLFEHLREMVGEKAAILNVFPSTTSRGTPHY